MLVTTPAKKTVCLSWPKPSRLYVNLLHRSVLQTVHEKCCVYQLVFVALLCACVCWNKSKVWEAICSQKLISVCEIRKQPLWCMVIRNTSPPRRPATAMHNHHDLFKWLMKYASVKSELLLLSPPFVPFPSFLPCLFLSIYFFFVLGLVQPLRLSKSLPLCSAVAEDVWKTMRKQGNYTRCMGSLTHTHLESAEETPCGGSPLWTHERFMRRKKNNKKTTSTSGGIQGRGGGKIRVGGERRVNREAH